MINRILETDFVWGFRDILAYTNLWIGLMKSPSGVLPSGQECNYIRQSTHDFFNSLSFMVGRECGYEIWYEKYV